MKIDYYKKKTYKRPYRQFDITEILRQIQDGTYRNEVEKVRKATTQEEKDAAKYEASGFTFSGTFKERRSDSLIQHSGLVAIDIDGLNERVGEEKERLEQNPYTFSVFRSISNTGLRVLVKVPDGLDAHTHKLYYNAIGKFLNVESDSQAQDVSRYTNVTYDQELYYNPDSLIWNMETENTQQPEQIKTGARNERKIEYYKGDVIMDEDEKIQVILSWTRNEFKEGSRNRCVYEAACNLCEYGVTEDKALEVLAEYAETGFSVDEIEKAVRSAYKHTQPCSKELYRKEPLGEMKELFSKVKTDTDSKKEQDSSCCHLWEFMSVYRPGMKVVIVDSDEVAEMMGQIIPGFQWFSTNGQQLTAQLLRDIPKSQGVLVCPRLQKSLYGYQWKKEVEDLQWDGWYNLKVWRWWEKFSPDIEDYLNECSVYDVICRE